MKQLIICLFIVLLASCASTVESIKNDQDVISNLPSSENLGYALLGIELNQALKEIIISGDESIRLTHKDLQVNSNYLLLPLKAGKYSIKKIAFSKYRSISVEDEKYWSFEVKDNEISYVGDLELKYISYWFNFSVEAELINNSSLALEFMEERFPNILSKRAMSYRGPGYDDFLLTQTGGGK